MHIPLDPDSLFEISLMMANGGMFQSTRGNLDDRGQATAGFAWPGTNDPAVVGMRIYHAVVVSDAVGTTLMASNAVELTIVR